jgi:hypothetical protein
MSRPDVQAKVEEVKQVMAMNVQAVSKGVSSLSLRQTLAAVQCTGLHMLVCLHARVVARPLPPPVIGHQPGRKPGQPHGPV